MVKWLFGGNIDKPFNPDEMLDFFQSFITCSSSGHNMNEHLCQT